MADVLFRGMKMPKNCGTCKFAGVCDVLPASEWPDIESIMLNDVIGVDGARHKDCPFFEIPPHGRLGDLDRLVKVMCEGLAPSERDSGFKTPVDILRAIADAPTIIPASEVKDNV